ncbi:MAG TPA: winged helix-turn-helix domain-containing protein, partial [Polyangia bacterium]
MTFLEAAFDVLRLEGKPLHYKELTERVVGRKLLTFVGRTPEVTMQTQLTSAIKKAPGNPFVRVKPGVFGLLRYPEISAEERAAATAKVAKPEEPAKRSRGADDDAAAAGDGRGRRRRRGGRGRDREREHEDRPSRTAAPPAASAGDDGEAEEPHHGGGLSAEARAAALAETGVLEGDDDAGSDEESPRAMDSMDDDETAGAAPREGAGAPAEGADEDEGDEGPEEAGPEGAEAGPEGAEP